MRQNGNLYDAIQTQKATMFLLLLVLVAVAAFNLVSNLVMTDEMSRPAGGLSKPVLVFSELGLIFRTNFIF